jgi:transcription elongation factor Elf1
VARTRTTKKLAQRIDLNYFKRPSASKRAKFWISVVPVVIALAWITGQGFSRDSRIYSSGHLSEVHSVLESQCAACHVQQAGGFSAKAADAACLSCHDGPVHHTEQVKALECAVCHSEHHGRVNISAASDQACGECHADLKTTAGTASYATHIRSLEDGHPQFAAVRDGSFDPSTLKLNHSIHMQPIRRGPNGPIVNLDCGDCHRPEAVKTNWKYADARYAAAKPSYSEEEEIRVVRANVLTPHAPMTGRELMAPVKFGTACSSCHLLTFDKRFEEGVPHDQPEVIHMFVVKKLRDYIAAHPNEVRVPRDPDRELAGKPILPETRILTPEQWVAERTAEDERLLWGKTCQECHALKNVSPGAGNAGAASAALPEVEKSNTTVRWMPHAKFDHDAHRGFTCVSCHAKAVSSTEAKDVLLPGIATCQTCHAPGLDHAESRCAECHTYHDWSKRQEVTPKFTLPALRTASR